MSRRTRSVSWCEGRITSELSKRKVITTHLALSALVFSREMRSIQEEHNFDIALAQLLSRREIKQEQDEHGFTVYRLVA